MRPQLHPACAAFPPLPDKECQSLAADIRLNGLIDTITLTLDGLLLDGRCRWDACGIAGVEPRTTVYEGNDPIGFVLSKNKHRRHLTKSQKSMAIARLANLQHGSNQYQSKIVDYVKDTIHTSAELAKLSGEPLAYINYARTVLTKGEPHIIKMVDDGMTNVRVAAEAVRETPRSEQTAWTTADVEREGRKVIKSYPSNHRDQPEPEAVKAPTKRPTRHIPDPPYTGGPKFPTREESGYPPEGSSIADYRAFFEANGRTPLVSKTAKELSQDHIKAMALGAAVTGLARDDVPDADAFLDAIGRMLSHVPAGKETDYAAIARRVLMTVEKHLPAALERLATLDAKLRTRKTDRGSKPRPAAPDSNVVRLH